MTWNARGVLHIASADMTSSPRRISLASLSVVVSAISGFLWLSSAHHAAVATEEPARAAALIESGEGVMVTAEATGVDVHRSGRHSGVRYCPTYEYIADSVKHPFIEKRLCETTWFQNDEATELVYEIADPAVHYWVSDFEGKSLTDGAESNILWGQWGLGLAGLLGVGALLPVRKRPGQS